MTARQTIRRKARRDRLRARLDRVDHRLRPVVTAFADASFSPRLKRASYGAWIKADGRPAIIKSGALSGDVPTSTEAELRALANALAIARRLVAEGACVMLQSDCEGALSWILRALPTACHRPAPGGLPVVTAIRYTPTMRESAGLQAIVKIAAEAKLQIVVRHVRGHTQHQDGRHGVNRLVDGLAAAART